MVYWCCGNLIVLFVQTETDKKALSETGGIPIGIGKNAHIRKAIIDKNARIGENVKVFHIYLYFWLSIWWSVPSVLTDQLFITWKKREGQAYLFEYKHGTFSCFLLKVAFCKCASCITGLKALYH